MKTEITITVTKDCYILCNVFRFMLADLIVYYMSNVSLPKFLDAKEDEYVHPATYFFVQCTV
jgi:hypothetical protein